MPIFQRDLTADPGADLVGTTEAWTVNFAPVDLTGRTARLDIYKHAYDESPFLSLTGTLTSNGQVTTNGAAGTCSLNVTAASTEALPLRIGPLKYALWVDDPNPVTGVTVTDGGSGYTSAPTVSFSGGGGSGASATATVEGGVVTGVALTSPGAGYTTAPTVSFAGGGGSSAAATAAVEAIQTVLFQAGSLFLSSALGGER